VKKYGLRLMPELYQRLNPMSFEAAAQMEKELAEDLRAEGYTVTGGK
jgi:predicted DNA-binding protein